MHPIRHLRQAQGWTQEDLGRRINRSVSYVSHLEKGDYKPGRDVLLQLAALFQVAPADLLLTVPIETPKSVAHHAT